MSSATFVRRSGRARTALVLALAGAAGVLGGCASYVTPGGPANFRELTVSDERANQLAVNSNQPARSPDAGIEERFNRRPAADFPASIAMVRIQGSGYTSYTSAGYGRGRFTVVTSREPETEAQLGEIAAMPMVRGVAPVNRLLLHENMNTLKDLREVAAELQADILLLYTFDTTFRTDTTIPFLGTITLGLFPNEEARVSSTASAVFVDSRTGYVYGLAEATAKWDQLANAWTSKDAIDQSRRRAESDAFAKLVGELKTTWSQIAMQYGTPPGAGTEPEKLNVR